VIVRVFRAVVHQGKQADFEKFVREVAAPTVWEQGGVVAQYSGKPMESGATEFVFVSIWKDLESLKKYAGEDWKKSVLEPGEEHLLAKTSVDNYEVFDSHSR
jgi:heme-degrading monooxygenase HmoA